MKNYSIKKRSDGLFGVYDNDAGDFVTLFVTAMPDNVNAAIDGMIECEGLGPGLGWKYRRSNSFDFERWGWISSDFENVHTCFYDLWIIFRKVCGYAPYSGRRNCRSCLPGRTAGQPGQQMYSVYE